MKLSKFKILFSILMFLFCGVSIFPLTAQDKTENLHFNSWSLIIYRPQNNADMNTVRCWLKLEDENGNDVTYSAINSASYEWVNGDKPKSYNSRPPLSSVFNPNITSPLYKYEKTYYLSGGMAMHLNLNPGKYKISFFTPADKLYPFNYEIECENTEKWLSNVFEYNTENPAKVIFVVPTANDNGFYNGGWYIDYQAPGFFKKITIPKMQ